MDLIQPRMEASQWTTVFGNAVLSRRPLARGAVFRSGQNLPIEAVHSAGTDKAIYRLGDDMAVRLPRIHWATGQVDK